MSERKEQITAALRAAREELQAVIGGLKDADWQRPTPCEGWTIRDVVAHLSVGEPGNILIARRILNDEEGVVAGFDLNRYNMRQVEKRRDKSTSELMNDLATARAETLALLSALSEGQLDKRGRRTTGEETTVEQVFYQIARHDQMHGEHVRRALD